MRGSSDFKKVSASVTSVPTLLFSFPLLKIPTFCFGDQAHVFDPSHADKNGYYGGLVHLVRTFFSEPKNDLAVIKCPQFVPGDIVKLAIQLKVSAPMPGWSSPGTSAEGLRTGFSSVRNVANSSRVCGGFHVDVFI